MSNPREALLAELESLEKSHTWVSREIQEHGRQLRKLTEQQESLVLRKIEIFYALKGMDKIGQY